MARIFGRGLIVLLPLTITVLIIGFVAGLADSIFAPIIDPLVGPDIPGLGLLILIAIVFVVGLLSHRFAEGLGRTVERGIVKFPFVGRVYVTAKQVAMSVSGGQESSFDTVVSVPFPTESSLAIGFLTREFTNDAGLEFGIVYIPTTPVPSSGFLLVVPMGDISILNMSSPEAMQMVVTGGIVVPGYLGDLGK
ncbi:MAG: DUF502 domain-containing protein [Chloroflexi bacterium]|nr:DUF502 domain-containing protein [Chloroflexota bacterium]